MNKTSAEETINQAVSPELMGEISAPNVEIGSQQPAIRINNGRRARRKLIKCMVLLDCMSGFFTEKERCAKPKNVAVTNFAALEPTRRAFNTFPAARFGYGPSQ